MECVFTPLSWGLKGLHPGFKRDVRLEVDLSRCVCNETFVGESCCYSKDGMVSLE